MPVFHSDFTGTSLQAHTGFSESLTHNLSPFLRAGEQIRPDHMIRVLLFASVLFVLASCDKPERPPVNTGLLSTDTHLSVAQYTLVLPFVALEHYAYQQPSFSLNRQADRKQALDALSQFLQDSGDSRKPLALDSISIAMTTYGWNDGDMGQIKVCPLLTREWARSVCDNPWAAIQQALPRSRFRLVDLRRLDLGDPRGLVNCRDGRKPHRQLPQKPGEAATICEAMVYGGRDDQYQNAVLRIDGDLGAIWTVWRHDQNGETAEAMTQREGKAIATFVKYALGKNEDFSKLHAAMCRLRRPGSVDSSHGADCAVLGKTRKAWTASSLVFRDVALRPAENHASFLPPHVSP